MRGRSPRGIELGGLGVGEGGQRHEHPVLVEGAVGLRGDAAPERREPGGRVGQEGGGVGEHRPGRAVGPDGPDHLPEDLVHAGQDGAGPVGRRGPPRALAGGLDVAGLGEAVEDLGGVELGEVGLAGHVEDPAPAVHQREQPLLLRLQRHRLPRLAAAQEDLAARDAPAEQLHLVDAPDRVHEDGLGVEGERRAGRLVLPLDQVEDAVARGEHGVEDGGHLLPGDPPALVHRQRPVAREAQPDGHLGGPLAAHLGGRAGDPPLPEGDRPGASPGEDGERPGHAGLVDEAQEVGEREGGQIARQRGARRRGGAAEGRDADGEEQVGRGGEQLERARPVGQLAPDVVGPGGHAAVGVDEQEAAHQRGTSPSTRSSSTAPRPRARTRAPCRSSRG